MKLCLVSYLKLALVGPMAVGVGATFSIAAVDVGMQQVGGAGSSCVASGLFPMLYHAVPGKGVLHSQAVPPNDTSPVYTVAREMLEEGDNPEDIIETIADPQLDDAIFQFKDLSGNPIPNLTVPEWQLRQYGVVDLQAPYGRSAGYTGDLIKDFYFVNGLTEEAMGVNYTQTHQASSVGNFTSQAQGNIVTEDTVSNLTIIFHESRGCDLADKLYHAIITPYLVTQEAKDAGLDKTHWMGDVRCFQSEKNEQSASSIFLHVDAADGTEVVHIDIVSDEIGGQTINPLPFFQEQYLAWRNENPCPSEEEVEAEATQNESSASAGSMFGNLLVAVANMAPLVAIGGALFL